MKESTKRIIDWLTLATLGLLATIIWFDYTNNKHPSKIWIVLSIFAIPFAVAALIWLVWRLLSIIPRGERTKRIIDWLTLIPLGFWPATLIWSHYTHNDHPSAIWIVLISVNFPFALASLIWLALRVEEIKILRW